jgi:hypothetical protein
VWADFFTSGIFDNDPQPRFLDRIVVPVDDGYSNWTAVVRITEYKETCAACCSSTDCSDTVQTMCAGNWKGLGTSCADHPCAPSGECPCWTEEELAAIKDYKDSVSGDTFDWAACGVDGHDYNEYENEDWWQLHWGEPFAYEYIGAVTREDRTEGLFCGYYHWFMDGISDGDLVDRRVDHLAPGLFAICESQLNQAGADLGVDCFQ